jgi:hypothetical protein
MANPQAGTTQVRAEFAVVNYRTGQPVEDLDTAVSIVVRLLRPRAAAYETVDAGAVEVIGEANDTLAVVIDVPVGGTYSMTAAITLAGGQVVVATPFEFPVDMSAFQTEPS